MDEPLESFSPVQGDNTYIIVSVLMTFVSNIYKIGGMNKVIWHPLQSRDQEEGQKTCPTMKLLR